MVVKLAVNNGAKHYICKASLKFTYEFTRFFCQLLSLQTFLRVIFFVPSQEFSDQVSCQSVKTTIEFEV